MSQQAKKEQILKLRNNGLSFGEIAKELGISRSSVASICKRSKERQIERCKNCGVVIKQTLGHRRRIYCSARCRKKWWKNNDGNHYINNKVICLSCGRKFIYHETKIRRYCSLACAYKGKRKEVSDNEE